MHHTREGCPSRGESLLLAAAGEVINAAAASMVNQGQQQLFQNTSQAIINLETFFERLNRLLPPPSPNQPPPRKRLRDAEFMKIADWCKLVGKPQWALRPRTFIVLHMIGRVDAIEDFINENLSDIALPYSDTNLPPSLTGDARARFLEYQNNVLTGQAAMLEKSGSEHQHVQGSAEEFFIDVEALGKGTSSDVRRVVGRLSLKHFAL